MSMTYNGVPVHELPSWDLQIALLEGTVSKELQDAIDNYKRKRDAKRDYK